MTTDSDHEATALAPLWCFTLGTVGGAGGALLDRDVAVPGAGGVIHDGFFYLGKSHGFRVTQHRDQQTPVRGDSNTDVVVVVIDNVGTFHRCVDYREGPQRFDRGFHKK
mgnify:CR=1 FL=1